ncbi:MAG: MBL fold metallo-hydrolase [Flammeovirgaceae bacterium]
MDETQKKWWLFEATPDITEQLQLFRTTTNGRFNYLPDGVFITHAHIGHYTGLMYLGREALAAKEMPVFVLPRFSQYLKTNGPWSQLVALLNIQLTVTQDNTEMKLSETISVKPFAVPHRDEYSETAGFRIATAGKKYLFIPDIDKWSKWSRNIVDEVKQVDIAFLDATFYQQNELPGRNMAEVPHPFVVETISLFGDSLDKKKIFFIHFNHSNPLLWNPQSQQQLSKLGFGLALQGQRY